MSILNIINQVKPSSWDDLNIPYGKNFAVKTLNNYNQEYRDVIEILQTNGKQTTGIKHIQRVQHPFAYGSFMLRKKQLEIQGYSEIVPYNVFFNIKLSQLSDALEYNLDQRRTNLNSNNKECLIIAECLKPTQYLIQRDSEIYPTYVVHYNSENSLPRVYDTYDSYYTTYDYDYDSYY